MGLFKKTEKPKTEPVIEYSEHEQGAPPPEPAKDKLDQVLSNQAVIVQNQQLILNTIVALGQRLEQLANPPEETEGEGEEPPVATKVKKKGKA
jgi:hypothetical protein